MKFSHQLKFNAVPEWSDQYVAYAQLKKLIYQAERDIVQERQYEHDQELDHNRQLLPEDGEQEPLLGARQRAAGDFLPALDRELARITEFYILKEGEYYGEAASLMGCIQKAADDELFTSVHVEADREDGQLSDTATTATGASVLSAQRQAASWRNSLRRSRHSPSEFAKSLALDDTSRSAEMGSPQVRRTEQPPSPAAYALPSSTLQERALALYIALSDLQRYAQINYTAFSKILKKYDKVTGSAIRRSYMNDTVRAAYPFLETTKSRLEEQLHAASWAHSVASGIEDHEENERYLRKHLRERVVFSRNTVWRDMIGMERKVTAIGVESATPESVSGDVHYLGFSVPRSFALREIFWGFVCLLLFIGTMQTDWFGDTAQQRCFALLVFVSGLWAFEVVPLFVTALLVPFLVVVLGVQKGDDGLPLPSKEAARQIFGSMFGPVIMLLLGGFTIAAALSKYDIARRVAVIVLSRAGSRPSSILLASMFVATFASMWISNVAAPVLCFSIIQPILRTLPPDAPFGRCLVLGVALASNIGGMASPISSPQNLIALDVMHPTPSWLQWFAIALPVVTASNVLIWRLLLAVYRPTATPISTTSLRTPFERVNREQLVILLVTVGTIILWCTETYIERYIGDMGVLSAIPIIIFFGTNLLTKEDFNNFLWTVVMLAMGGIALGQAVRSSGLLLSVAQLIRQAVDGYAFWQIVVIFVSLVTIAATFVSHTVAALVFLPIINQVGMTLPDAHPRLLVMAAALMCSGAMGLPVSGFPNMNAAMLEDPTGKPYLNSWDFLRCGIPATLLALVVVLFLGGAIMVAIGF